MQKRSKSGVATLAALAEQERRARDDRQRAADEWQAKRKAWGDAKEPLAAPLSADGWLQFGRVLSQFGVADKLDFARQQVQPGNGSDEFDQYAADILAAAVRGDVKELRKVEAALTYNPLSGKSKTSDSVFDRLIPMCDALEALALGIGRCPQCDRPRTRGDVTYDGNMNVPCRRCQAARHDANEADVEQPMEQGVAIPVEYRTKPMTLTDAARKLGYTTTKDDSDAGRKQVKRDIEARILRAEKITPGGRKWRFDKRDFHGR